MVGHELEAGRHYLKERPPTAGLGRFRLNQCFPRDGWFRAPETSWLSLQPGRYQVRGFCQNENVKEDKFSESLIILDDDIDNHWNNLSARRLDIPELLYALSPDPHQDILVAQGKNYKNLNIPGFLCANLPAAPRGIKVFHHKKLSKEDDLIFSGSAFYNDRLVYGQEEASSVVDKLGLIDAAGDFVAALATKNCLILTNDYFGVQKIYCFKSESIFLASNRVHLLLLGMTIAGIRFEMDPSMVMATLASGYVQPFQQIFSQDLMVRGVKLLPIDRRIIISEERILFEPKLISDLLADNVAPIRENEYECLIEEGVKDILSQAQAVICHPKFNRVIFDATGGMDSRAILAAASRCDRSRKSVTVNAMDTVGIPLDIKIACQVASLLGLKHDESPETIEICDGGFHKIHALSQLLGTYFAYDLRGRNGEMVAREDAINVTGFFGEICLRPYYSRSYLDQSFGREEISEDALDLYEFIINENKSSLSNPAAKNELLRLWIQSIKSLPGASPLEKYDLHYLFYRNGLHCSDIFRMKWNTPRVGVLQSKNLFSLKRKLYDRSAKTLLQNDVIARIRPELLLVPYASSRDNDDLAKTSLNSTNNFMGGAAKNTMSYLRVVMRKKRVKVRRLQEKR